MKANLDMYLIEAYEAPSPFLSRTWPPLGPRTRSWPGAAAGTDSATVVCSSSHRASVPCHAAVAVAELAVGSRSCYSSSCSTYLASKVLDFVDSMTRTWATGRSFERRPSCSTYLDHTARSLVA